MSKVLDKVPCPSCKEKDYKGDNLIRYEDGGSHCFACGYNPRSQKLDTRAAFVCSDIEEYRGISKKTRTSCMTKIGKKGNRDCTLYLYPKKNPDSFAYKYKYHDNKDFLWEQGTFDDDVNLFLLSQCEDYTKPIYITEGEDDALSLHEIGFQACSIMRGAQSAKKDIERSLETLLKFPKIILFLDNDLAGKKALKEVLEILPQDKTEIIKDYQGKKDANELLVTGREHLDAVARGTQEILPDGIILGTDLNFDTLRTEKIKAIPLPFKYMQENLGGLEYGNFYLVLAGAKAGKSTFLRELALWYRRNVPELKLGCFFLEENKDITPLAFAAIDQNVPLGALRRDRNLLSEEQWADVQQNVLCTNNLVFLGNEFKRTTDNILNKIEYLVKVQKYDMIILDHISYVVARSGISKNGERRDIDEFLYKLQDLVQNLKFILIAVNHVNDSESKVRWDQGEVPNIYSGRGSRALAQVPDVIISLARDLTNPAKSDILQSYVSAVRWGGKIGKTDTFTYFGSTGRLKTITEIFEGKNETN